LEESTAAAAAATLAAMSDGDITATPPTAPKTHNKSGSKFKTMLSDSDGGDEDEANIKEIAELQAKLDMLRAKKTSAKPASKPKKSPASATPPVSHRADAEMTDDESSFPSPRRPVASPTDASTASTTSTPSILKTNKRAYRMMDDDATRVAFWNAMINVARALFVISGHFAGDYLALIGTSSCVTVPVRCAGYFVRLHQAQPLASSRGVYLVDCSFFSC